MIFGTIDVLIVTKRLRSEWAQNEDKAMNYYCTYIHGGWSKEMPSTIF